MKCPAYEICVTPQLYGKSSHKKYVKTVCLTNEHKRCTHYKFSQLPIKDSPEWNRIRKWLEKLHEDI